MSNECQKCERQFPSSLLLPLVVQTHGQPKHEIVVCPLCALDMRNKTHGLNDENFRRGSKAQRMLDWAREFLASKRRPKPFKEFTEAEIHELVETMQGAAVKYGIDDYNFRLMIFQPLLCAVYYVGDTVPLDIAFRLREAADIIEQESK